MTRNQKIDEYISKAQGFIPGLRASSIFSMFGGDEKSEPTSGKIELSAKFLNEKVLSEGKIKFTHYTSLRNAINILNSGSIRLYNCFNLNDKNEIKYLLDKSPIDFSEEEIDKYKREHFILSGSLIQDDNEEDYNLWRLYGDNCKGVAIIFEISEKITNWSKVYLQKVAYERDNKSNIYDYLKFHKEFNDKYLLFENKPELFALLSTGVKNEIWSVENEFRVIVKNPFNEYSLESNDCVDCNTNISKTLKHEYNFNGKLVSYVELPLHINDRKSELINLPLSSKQVDLIDYVPNLEIKKIILGPNSHLEDYSNFIDYITWVQSRLKCKLKVGMSKFQD
ncbi:DUF2971 domain-containing protein [Pedobacter aquae]|uniref:DUF2971 domain-containing protein n=1 Tax=Pedobacter aquae TaxID=2605747 RepID=A0A5C0VIM9_9SPHI|nr:DUF2971 domain-containing protein [Pedobacter aquae]QEK51050.1 DUF2971 domain-containing protein [Pedobacter aquae]